MNTQAKTSLYMVMIGLFLIAVVSIIHAEGNLDRYQFAPGQDGVPVEQRIIQKVVVEEEFTITDIFEQIAITDHQIVTFVELRNNLVKMLYELQYQLNIDISFPDPPSLHLAGDE